MSTFKTKKPGGLTQGPTRLAPYISGTYSTLMTSAGMNRLLIIISVLMALLLAGCGRSKSEKAAAKGIEALNNQEFERAAELLTFALASDEPNSDPAHAPAWLALGISRWNLGDAEGAREAFERAAALEPGSVSAHLNLAQLYLQTGRTVDARQELDLAVDVLRADERAEASPEHYFQMASLFHHRFGQPDTAAEFYHEVIRLGEPDSELVAKAQSVVGGNGNHATPPSNPAAQMVENLLARARQLSATHKPQAVAMCTRAALIARQQNLPELESKAVKMAVAIAPEQASALNLLASYLERQGKVQAARENYAKAWNASPRDTVAISGTARLALQAGDASTAQRALEAWVAIEPENPDVCFAYAVFFRDVSENRDAAKRQFRTFIERFPNDSRVSDARAFLSSTPPAPTPTPGSGESARQRSMTEVTKGIRANASSPDEARRHFKKAIELDPTNARAFLELGMNSHRAKLHDEAIAAYKSCLAIRENWVPAQLNLALVYREINQPANIPPLIESVLTSEPNNAVAHLVLADALAAGSTPRAAVQHYEAFLRLAPQHALASRAKEQLASLQ